MEPRLISYIYAKKFYKSHKLTPRTPLEILYNIANEDIKQIKIYLSPTDMIQKFGKFYENEPRFMDIEKINNMPQHVGKMYGYRNMFEHQFQYINGEIQNPKHVILPFPQCGISSRIDNHKFKI